MVDFNKNLNPVISSDVKTPMDYTSVAATSYATPYQESLIKRNDYEEGTDVFQRLKQFSNESIEDTSPKPISVSFEELEANKRYNLYNPTIPDYEDAAAQGQSTVNKMINGVGKGLLLTGTTFLQSTAGLIYGGEEWMRTGSFSGVYNNSLTKWIDDINKKAEDSLPNYYTNVEKNAHWYSPDKLFTANFFWDGIIKNMGFSVGSMLAANAWGLALKSIPLTAKLFSMGKAAETLEATEQGILAADKASATYGQIKSLSDKFIGQYNYLNPGGRAVVSLLGTHGEASFEAYNNMNEYRNQKIEEYKQTHEGQEPLGIDLEQIDNSAKDVGLASHVLNMALLSATQYIQLPKMMGSSYKAEKYAVNSVVKETEGIVKEGEKFIIKQPKNKLLATVKNIAPYTFSAPEGFEEGAQHAITKGTQDYYDKKYKNQDTNFIDSIVEGITQTLGTDEGMENILMGGLSGSLMMGYGRYKERKQLSAQSQAALSSSEGVNAGLNTRDFSPFTKSTFDAVNRGIVIQEEREEALKKGDKQTSKDLEADYIINYLTPRIKYGRFDLVRSDINDYRNLASTEEGFTQLQSEGKVEKEDTREAYLNRLNNLEKTADNVKSLYQSIHLRFGNLADKDGKPLYSEEVVDKMIYAASKISDYDQRIPNLSLELTKALGGTIVVSDVLDGLVKNDATKFNEAIKFIQNKSDILDTEKDELISSFKDLGEIALRRQSFIQEYNDIKNNPNKYKEEKSTLKSEKEKTITVKDKEGEREVAIGEEYYLGAIDYIDEDGVKKKRFPRLTILGENEDGTIKIKEAGGKIRDIDRKELEDYKLGKVADVNKSENSSFYFRNVIKLPDNEFFWNIGKDKKSKEFPEGIIPGKLLYSPKEDKLYFNYTQNGKNKYKEVGLDQFKPKKDFKRGIYYSKYDLTEEDYNDINNRESSGKTKKDVEARRGDKLRILNNLYNEIVSTSQKVDNLLIKKKAEFENISKELSELEEKILANEEDFDRRFKKPTFKKVVKESLDAASRLQKTKDELEKEIAELEIQKSTLDMEKEDILPYIEDMSQNIDELPAENKEFLEELREQKSLLEDAIKSTEEQLSGMQSLADKVSTTLDSVIDFVADLINKFQQKYPKAPTTIVAQEWIDFLKANPNFLKKKPDYRSDLKQLEDLVAQIEDLDINPSERHLQELNQNIKELKDELQIVQNRLKAIDKVLGKFEEIAQRNKEIREQEILLEKDKSLQADLLGTHIQRTETTTNNKETFDPIPKKSLFDVVRSTTASTFLNKPHQKRANRFGFNLPKLRKEFKGVVVSSKNEDKILKGLTKFLLFDNPDSDQTSLEFETPHLKKRIKYGVDDVLILIVTDKNGNLVDENGQTLPEGLTDKEKLDRAIYQVFPIDLKAEYFNPETNQWEEQSMFRSTEKQENIEALEKQFNDWRKTQLQKTELSTPQYLEASFGIPEYNTKTTETIVNGKPIQKQTIDFDNRTSVREAGLIDEETLNTNSVLDISTTNDNITEGKTSFKNTLGRVFLRIRNQGLVKLYNRKFNKKEASTIYDVVEQLCKNLYKKHTQSLSKDEIYELDKRNKELTNWLDSVIYWGIPKDVTTGTLKQAGYNSLWFEKGKLNISGKGTQFDFTPSALNANKKTIIALLEGMYHDTSVRFIKDTNWNNEYKEIIGIDKDGNPIYKTWKNYQTYLLSPEGRKNNEIPLTTIIRPLEDETDVNRKGIYFSLSDSEFELPKEAPSITQQKETERIEKEEEKVKTEKEITINTIENTILGEINFPKVSDIVNSENEEENMAIYKQLKEQYNKLKELFKCI